MHLILAEPKIHFVFDDLPADRVDAYARIECERCDELLHASNNEQMQPWVETGKGNYCFTCFIMISERYGDNREFLGVLEKPIEDEYPRIPLSNTCDCCKRETPIHYDILLINESRVKRFLCEYCHGARACYDCKGDGIIEKDSQALGICICCGGRGWNL